MRTLQAHLRLKTFRSFDGNGNDMSSKHLFLHHNTSWGWLSLKMQLLTHAVNPHQQNWSYFDENINNLIEISYMINMMANDECVFNVYVIECLLLITKNAQLFNESKIIILSLIFIAMRSLFQSDTTVYQIQLCGRWLTPCVWWECT